MTNKRFIKHDEDYSIVFFFDKEQKIKDKYGVNYYTVDKASFDEDYDDTKEMISMSYEQVVGLLNRQHDENIRLLQNNNSLTANIKVLKGMMEKQNSRISELEHEIDTLNGLYASDDKSFNHPFRLDFTKVMRK